MSNSSEEEQHPRFARMAVLGKSGADAGNFTAVKKKRNPPGNPDPKAEVVALSPKTLLATNRYICEVCHKGFQRDQNLQLHRRGHNLPWKLKQRTTAEVKKRVYVCPEMNCAHHDPNRALGDLTGIKKHYSRKHGEKKWKCDKCMKRYAVQSDWKAHAKICGTKEYRCDCGTIFSRKDSFVTHRAFCDALNEENYRANHDLAAMVGNLSSHHHDMVSHSMPSLNSSTKDSRMSISGSDPNKNKPLNPLMQASSTTLSGNGNMSSMSMSMGSSFMSATALLQKAAEMGAKVSDESISPILLRNFEGFRSSAKPTPETNSYSYSEVSSEAGNGRLFLPPVSYAGVMASKRGGDASGFVTAANRDPFSFNSSRMREAGEDNAGRRSGRMTQDFLGLGASGSMSVGSNGNQGCNEGDDEMYSSYQQMSNGPSAWEKHVWDF